MACGRRNYYYNLFRIYDYLPFNSCMQSYMKIYNEVFMQEKPVVVQRYFVTEVKVVELNENQLGHSYI